jgi:hypothetical protein
MQSTQSASSAIAEQKETQEGYFTVGAIKFSLMSLTTFGMYEVYWFYRNWQVIKGREGPGLSPIGRAIFAPLWAISMGRRFNEQAQAEGISLALPVISLGVAYFILTALWRLPDPYWLISALAFVPLLPFEFAARRLNGRGQLAAPTFGRFSGWNIAWLVIGTLLLALGVWGAFFPVDTP